MTAKKISPDTLSRRVVANVRRLRRARGWRASDLADKLTAAGCPVSLSAIANRESRPDPSRVHVDELFALAEVFGMSVYDLVAEAPTCNSCQGSPPAGFTCNNCGAVASAS